MRYMTKQEKKKCVSGFTIREEGIFDMWFITINLCRFWVFLQVSFLDLLLASLLSQLISSVPIVTSPYDLQVGEGAEL